MSTRVLPPDEWHRLAHTEVGALWETLPSTAQAIVVEDETGAIVGCWLVLPVVHVECLWIAEAHRGRTSVARRLWSAMRAVARNTFGASQVWTASVDDTVRTLVQHAGGTRVAGEHWVLPLGGARG